MHLILTHEQADFDAVAALLGAWLMHEDAIPVLPRRMNRNVRAFLNLYGAELPFIEARDLPAGHIDHVTLVDTQSLVTLKGMSSRTSIHVVDHHQPRPDLPDNWTMSNDRVGACTTLFVEDLQEHNGALNLMHATLLLLGIYEDSGSLTYASTTARDVRAAAHLLEQGASLRLAADYLNPPLSPEQRRLYDRLLAAAETLNIHGQTIMIAAGDAEDMNQEISSIAHKLRDLIDPDALFLLVNTVEGVRLVARSTSDRVDVSAVAAHFGGGGHDRAAAALVRSNTYASIEVVYAELKQMLPSYVRPAVTVGRIMSRKPLLLSPDTPVAAAAQLMQRYGYEGYPVIEDQKVIGLLTRRAVDRALSHHLNLTARSLMEAGSISVTSQDALEHLQEVMTSSGWGQIPVTDAQSGEVIGIVTRTDLLKTLSRDAGRTPGKKNLAEKLQAALPPARLTLLREIARVAREQRIAAYIVGGFVRDLVLDRPSLDFDIVVEGDAITLAHSLAKRFGGRVVSHARFGTAKWWIAEIRTDLLTQMPGCADCDPAQLPESMDLISSRTEFYDYPTALPTVERSSIKLDLHRRDFTINTMALRLDGRHYGDLYDYWGGFSDLRHKLVRVLHSLSFVDDPTRMLRAVRFEQRFEFRIDDRTRQLMKEAHPLLHQISGDRIRHEFNLILAEEKAPAILARLEELDLLNAIVPGLHWDDRLRPALQTALLEPLHPEWQLPDSFAGAPLRRVLGYLVWLSQIDRQDQLTICTHLRFPAQVNSALDSMQTLQPLLPGLVDAPPSLAVAQLESAALPALYAIHCVQSAAPIRALLHTYITRWRFMQPHIDGRELQKRGLPPGPAFRSILSTLRNAWLDGKICSEQQEEDLLQQIIHSISPNE